MERWRERFREILRRERDASETTSPLYDRVQGFWKRTEGGEFMIDPGGIAGWVLTCEEKGKRMKDWGWTRRSPYNWTFTRNSTPNSPFGLNQLKMASPRIAQKGTRNSYHFRQLRCPPPLPMILSECFRFCRTFRSWITLFTATCYPYPLSSYI
jgi:hypothetical protein